jgi:hypothetical protein
VVADPHFGIGLPRQGFVEFKPSAGKGYRLHHSGGFDDFVEPISGATNAMRFAIGWLAALVAIFFP